MAKIECKCGQLIIDQADFIKNKGRIIADQDYFDLFDEIENTATAEARNRITNYFSTEIYQCSHCNNIIIFRDHKRFDFSPLDKENSSTLLRSYLGQKWLGVMSAHFKNGQGELFWYTNSQSGFIQNLALNELKQHYHQKFKELKDLHILRHSFLNIDGTIEHSFNYSE